MSVVRRIRQFNPQKSRRLLCSSLPKLQSAQVLTKKPEDDSVTSQKNTTSELQKLEANLILEMKAYQDKKKEYEENINENLLKEYSFEIPLLYQPEHIEPKWQNYWEKTSMHYPHAEKDRRAFTMTSIQHGLDSRYNLNDCYQAVVNDVIVRRARMQGRDTVWIQTLADDGFASQWAIFGMVSLFTCELPLTFFF